MLLLLLLFWDIAPCSLIEIVRRFRDAYCLHRQDDDRTIYKRLDGAISQKTVIFS
jgi:hypothetical protein